MPRVKRGVAARKRHKKVLKSTKGQRGTKHLLYRRANEARMKSLAYAYRDLALHPHSNRPDADADGRIDRDSSGNGDASPDAVDHRPRGSPRSDRCGGDRCGG